MSKLDEMKEEINNLKFWLGIAVATFLAILGWSITNYETISFLLLSFGFVAVIFLGVAIILLQKNINKKIKNLRDL
ncbi:hypothetical protein LS72_010240 [Helicobacter apodemus]|uniref:Uncharacterized protein n=1 Tax=Helicobacter apodemus TaxID=135569 RepID=A0A4U8UBJ2_9HELI|nr:hypothetical protein [Helicobacter apodemus]MDE6958873.1 hypothetical protein [Helicobacter apodemus]TLE13119.1 hypothetical protein LS72_010240 [Helicobacter apodemus]